MLKNTAMMQRWRWIWLLAWLWPLSLPALDLSGQVESLTLSNGMRWLVLYRPEVPVFSGAVIVKAGGADESPGKTGLAHMFEHMAFKGSEQIGPGVVWEVLTRKGAADLNAFTAKDMTGYHASMPKHQFPLWAYVTSEMVFHPVMREFYTERDVVLEERRLRYDNSPQGTLMETLLKTAFPRGPYHTAPIGEASDLNSLTAEEAEQFHRRFYHPQNMVGVLVGAVPVSHAKRWLEKFFGRAAAPPPLTLPPPESFAFQGEKRKTIHFPAEPYLAIAFHKPAAPHRDDYVFDILDRLLCDGRTSRFYRALVEQQKWVSQVSCSNGFPGIRYENLFVILLTPNQGKALPDIERAVMRELHRVAEAVNEAELQKIRRSVLYDYYWGMEENSHLAELLAMTEALLGDWRYVPRYPEVIETITAEEVQAAAVKYFVSNNRVVIYRQRGPR